MLPIGIQVFVSFNNPARAADVPPPLLGSIQTTCAEDIAVYGDYVYVADGPGGIAVIDVSDPSSPRLENTLPTTYAFRIYVHSEHLYLCDGPAGMKVYSLAEPSSPVMTYSVGSLWAEGLDFADPYVYLADYYAGVKIFLFDDPAFATQVVEKDLARARDVDVTDNSLIVSDAVFGLVVFSLEAPTSPIWTFMQSFVQENYEDIVTHKGYSMIVRNDEESGILVFSTNDPFNVQEITTLSPARFISGLTGNNNLLLASCGEDGIIAYDMTDPATMLHLWSVDTPDYARRAKASGDFLYVADMAGLCIYEISVLGGDWQ